LSGFGEYEAVLAFVLRRAETLICLFYQLLERQLFGMHSDAAAEGDAGFRLDCAANTINKDLRRI